MTSISRLEEGAAHDVAFQPLSAHTSTLPNWLYILSFAPPCPSVFRQPVAFFNHPVVLYSIGTVCALAAGVGLPAFDITLGWWTKGITASQADPASILKRGSQAGYILTIVSVAFWVLFATFLTCFTKAGVNLSGHLREKYLAAVMIQDQVFFDRVGPGEIVTRSSKDIDSIRIGLGERLGYLLWTLSCIISAFVSAFVHSPRLAGVLFALIPFTSILFTGLGYWTDQVSQSRSPLDGKASSFIEQMLSSVRLVQSFDMAHHLLVKLETTLLAPLRIMSRKLAIAKSIEQAAAYGSAFLVYSMCFWYGGIDVSKGNSVGNVLTTFYNYINLFFAFATVVPHLIATTTAIQNIGVLRLQIERQPPIDVRDPSGLQLEDGTWEPSFELDNVTFAYPSRSSKKALDNVTVNIPAGKFTAFAGPSGSGKSTLASLILRMYDPQIATELTEVDRQILKTIDHDEPSSGTSTPPVVEDSIKGAGVVRFAGHDVRKINVRWLRSQVAVVLQNPQLISGTVFDNVVIGLTGTELEYRQDVHGISNPSPKAAEQLAQINDLVEDALRKAQAWEFVNELPDGMSTIVFGGRTGVLSGGQVQRIALARALVRQPRCLLLDEATSAVSADAELKIQESLVEEQRRRGMTLIIIAHRLSTLVAADDIVVMKDGRPVYSGTYDELVDPSCPDPTFRNMAQASNRSQHALVPPKDETTSSSATSSEFTRLADNDIRPACIDKEKSPLDQLSEQPDNIPPPLRSTRQAFSHVKFSLTTGVALGLVAGAAFVLAAWLHGRAVAALNITDIPLMRRSTSRWALWFLVLAICTFVVFNIHVFGLENAGEQIVSEFRRETVRSLIKQDIPFFEKESGGTGSLTAAAAHHPANVGSVVGVVLAQVVSNLSNFVATIILAFSLSWRLAVMVLPALSATMVLGYLNTIWLQVFEANIVEEDERQANFVSDAVNSAQLLASLSREAETLRQYHLKFTDRKIKLGYLIAAALALAGTQAMLNLFGALMFYWGAKQIAEGKVKLADLFSVIESVVVAIYICSKLLTYSGDFTRMRASLKVMQGWMDREPETGKFRSESGAAFVKNEKTAGFKFTGVELRYPSRPDILALKGVDVHLEPGRSYAFCGTSGAGKSSILAVLQRFYDPTGGSITLDGQDIRSMDVRDLRAQMGYVSQEPVLFEGTIRWNLIAGSLTPDRVTQAELEFACEQACILDFIRTLPDGFETDLGMKGGRLSGGQRQRLCIARALLRKPRILLLDEATSALDGQSEAHVQQALDNASKGRLTITIGHRLSSIKGADVIFLMEQGQIAEIGSHQELLERRGKYFELVQAQL